MGVRFIGSKTSAVELAPGIFFASQTWVFGGVVHAELYGNFFGAACVVLLFVFYLFWEVCLRYSGVSPYIKNIGLGVLIFMAQQVAKHMAKAGGKNVQFHGTTDAKIEVNYCGSAKHETRV